MKKQPTSTEPAQAQDAKKWVVVMCRGALAGKYITPKKNLRDGYSFTDHAREAWTFPSEAQAKRKAEIVSEHMQAFATHLELTQELMEEEQTK